MIVMGKAFVIHTHTGYGPTHYDLMLQEGRSLATWQLAQAPTGLAPGDQLPARRLKDHRLHYLTYEGPVSGDRGRVDLLEAGTYSLLERHEGLWRVEFRGRSLRGTFELLHGGAGEDWTFRRLPG